MTQALAKLPAFVPPGDLETAKVMLWDAALSMHERAYVAGRVLIHVKEVLTEHGEFLPWLAVNFPMSRATASRLMAFARECDESARLLDYEPSKCLTMKHIVPHVSRATGENEWYTPPEYVEAARAVMGGIDCDPASSEIANRTVQAERFYTADTDGLDKPWGPRVWINPPYSQPLIRHFAQALVARVRGAEVEQACVLVNNATETDFFQSMLAVASAVCFPRGRIRFLDPNGEPSGAPLQGQAVLYVGEDVAAFYEHFHAFGAVLPTMLGDTDE